MEVIFEFLFELIIGGFADASGNPRIPVWLRMIFAAIVGLPLAVIMIIIAVSSFSKGNIGSFALFLGIALLFIGLTVFLWVKILRKK